MFKPVLFLSLFLVFSEADQASEPYDRPVYGNNSLEYWENLRIIPLRFFEKRSDEAGNIYLSAAFASNFTVEAEKINFVLSAAKENKPTFFEQSKEWEERIDQKTFLKKFKKDFWLTTYLKTERENIIVSVHQFKQWQSLKVSYATNPNRLQKNLTDPDFWKELRMRVVFVYKVAQDRVHWLFLSSIDKTEPFVKSDYELMSLDGDSSLVKKRQTVNQLRDFRILEQGIFLIQENTVFHKSVMENAKGWRVLKFNITDPRLRLRPLVVDREYFVKNASQLLWICFYDSRIKSLSRVVETLNEPLPVDSKR